MALQRRNDAPGIVIESCVDDFLAYRLLLKKVVGRFVKAEEVEDILQETFLNFYVAALNQPIKNPCGFMVSTARNISLNYINKSAQKMQCSIEELIDADFEELVHNVEQEYQSAEIYQGFCEAVNGLAHRCRRVFILKKIYGFSQREISKRLGISQRTVENHVARGMKVILTRMAKEGHLSEKHEKINRSVN